MKTDQALPKTGKRTKRPQQRRVSGWKNNNYMKIQCEVGKIESLGDAAKVKLTNVKRQGQAEWQEYGPEISLRVPLSKAKSFPIGRCVKVTVQAC